MSLKTMSLFIAAISLVFATTSQGMTAGVGPKSTIERLFDGMRAGDGVAIRELIIEGASLDRVTRSGELRQGTFDNWINWVDQQNQGDADEEIFEVEVNEYGGIATVWAPFVVRYKGELAGCGVNQFTLAKKGEDWRIIHGIDTAYDGDCAVFKESYASAK